MTIKYSFIIPVYNRPGEIKELLESFLVQDTDLDYEILIIEDGSTISSEDIVTNFYNLPVIYYYKENSGPGDSRNYGMSRAHGDYFIILDSDCILPSGYFKNLTAFLNKSYFDCFGGPDAAHKDFTPLQKAINYTMTSFFTTGGIRGNRNKVQKFEPRSFNMGLSKKAFLSSGGFGDIHPGEDPDLVQRLLKMGFTTGFSPEVFVYHKRRISWKKFLIQVKKFGTVRAILNEWHPHSAKITFWFPSLFVIFCVIALLLLFFKIFIPILFLLVYLLVVFLDSSLKNKSIYIGFLSVLATFIQFFGYGIAFLKASFTIKCINKDVRKMFPQYFFK